MYNATDSNKDAKLTERFLQDARDAHQAVSMYLISGFQLKGQVVEFDEEAILFSHKDIHQLVMRSAVVSMYPVSGSKQESRDWWRAYSPAD